MPLDAPLRALAATLATDRADLHAAVEQVPPAVRERRPAPGAWSVAEVLEHLAIVEERATGIVAQLAAAAPPRTPDDQGPSAIAFDRGLLQDRTQRVQAPPPIQPTGTGDAAAAWARLTESRAGLLAALEGASGRDLGAVQRMHPRLGQLSGYEWIAALGGHEARHAAQIQEIARALGAA